jgi:hypothetical protein
VATEEVGGAYVAVVEVVVFVDTVVHVVPSGLDCQLYTNVPVPSVTVAVRMTDPFKVTVAPDEMAIVGSGTMLITLDEVVAEFPQPSVTVQV